MSLDAVSLDPHETLYVPMRRRFIKEYLNSSEGQRELHIYYGTKEIYIEELDLHSFGEQLCLEDSFMAGAATRWTPGEPYPWERVKELLEALLAEGIVSREPPTLAFDSETHRKYLAFEARREAPTEPMWWNPDASDVMRKLTGIPLELGFLEAMLPVYRIAHPAIDAEGRHIGESNVFPEAMRMKVETEFKACHFAGSRYRNSAPMNVTALKSMMKHWKPMMHAVLAVRRAFLRDDTVLPDGRWRMGDLHAVACAVLAVPSFMLMRANDPVPNGTLDPVLSNIYRVTDGVRMVAAFMLFLPEEPMTYDTPISSAELLYVSDRDNHYLSTRGVCAGPPNLMEEYFQTLMDGRPVAGEPPTPFEWANDIVPGVDYGQLGLQLYSLQFNLWSYMCRAYEHIRAAVFKVEGESDGFWGRMRERMAHDWEMMRPTRLHTATQRNWAEARYIEMFDRAQRGVSTFREESLVRLQDVFTPVHDAVYETTREHLRGLVRERSGATSGPRMELADAIADATAEYLTLERSALLALENVQRETNALLKRPHPERRLTNKDLALHHRMRAGTIGVLPYLLDVFRDELGVDIDNSPEGTRLSQRGNAA
ncbi:MULTISPECIES: hypothetical protein [unclassified Myxococcus]|uniref:hypothetical protein n=1 Tax=unclassified Myxococcus TaxID=2648731 RepID=UPI00157B8DA7|nr:MULTISPECIES: hypothetical protein [unclassified Myxococcus]NTX07510.1 hypothetical protein [Myxococcus sp. CA040A]NTX10815.1 hypothetical protein [Myxococcus sp. CA056]